MHLLIGVYTSSSPADYNKTLNKDAPNSLILFHAGINLTVKDALVSSDTRSSLTASLTSIGLAGLHDYARKPGLFLTLCPPMVVLMYGY